MPINLVSANIGQNQPLPANGRIELGFDRLLLPASVTRQTFVLTNASGNMAYTPTIAYDPVARIVTITPLSDPGQALVSGQTYDLVILAPQNASDVNGLRAIDGATMPKSPRVIAFSVTDPTPTGPPTVAIDFCRDIYPITSLKCSLPICHGTSGTTNFPAAGLLLDPPSGIPATAVGRVAQGSNTGPQSLPSPPTLLFGEDMPIIDATGNSNGNPGNSWLMYKILMAVPSPEPVEDAGTPDATTNEEAGAADATVGASDAGSSADGASTPDGGTTDGGTADDGAAPAGAVDAGAADAGAVEAGTSAPPVPPPIDVAGLYGSVAFKALSAAEVATLSNYIQGRAMPFPPAGPPTQNPQTDPLTLDEMERMSLWIAQGASAPATCP